MIFEHPPIISTIISLMLQTINIQNTVASSLHHHSAVKLLAGGVFIFVHRSGLIKNLSC